MMGEKGKTIKVGVIGLGGRGIGQMKTLLEMPDVEVVAVCDLYEDRVQEGIDAVKEAKNKTPKDYLDYTKLIARKDIDAVFVFSSWTSHIRIAIDALQANKYVAMEVGGAASVQECWDLVRASEESGKPCMLLENCCYDRIEMAILNMIKKNMFGELIHCQGGYEHDLRAQICYGDEKRHYRLNNFVHRNGELYPTHELGPICKYLDVNRGNRMISLTSMATKSRGLGTYMKNFRPEDPVPTFNQGDIVTTMIKCANGESIVLVHDCSLPRPYSRGLRVQGIKGIYMEDNKSICIEGITEENGAWDHYSWEPFDNYLEKYEHPLWKEYQEFGLKGGHGGMDYLVLRSFVESVQNNTLPPIDVYDTAAWMSITCLSEESIALGSMPVSIPDFTNGRWINRDEPDKTCYSLDDVYEEVF